MTYCFTIYYADHRGFLTKMRMREHSYRKVREKFAKLYPIYDIVSIVDEPIENKIYNSFSGVKVS